MYKNIKKVFIYLVVVLNLILPLNVFAQELEKGQGSVKEAIKNGNKEFYTITTPSEKTYYLVIDFSKPERNVYFLKAVDEIDLLDLAGVNEIIYNPTETTEITSELSSEETSEDELKKEEISTNKNKLDILTIISIIGLVALVLFLIYDKFIKNKNNNNLLEDDYEDFEEENQEQEEKSEDEFLDGLANRDKE